ncbi:MAG: putative lipid II flippase FtsW [Nitrospirae bacterium]|nr:MAG: putative lipid II flippase FtsW [Nitrospirota bacterium]
MLKKGRIDIWLLFSTLGLTMVGVLMVYSVQAAKGMEMIFLKRHIFWVLLGFAGMIMAMKLGLERLKTMAYLFFGLSLVLLTLVFVPGLGVKINGARRWIELGAFRFQPYEMVKLCLIIALARFLYETENKGWTLGRFYKPLGVVLFVQALLVLQPDFGGAMLLGLIVLMVLFAAGAPLRYFLPVVLGVLSLSVVLILKAPYRLERITGFLDPWKDPRGEGFQLIQSLVALGRGGLTGVGIGNSQQKLQFLPEVRTDFIFSIIGEEMGFVGAFVVVSLFVLFLWRGYRIMSSCSGAFCRYLTFGVVTTIVLQAVLNMAVVSGLVPTKGLPLPFISYGGSAMVMNLTAVGIVLAVSRGEEGTVYADKERFLKSIARRRLRREGLI